MHWVKAKFDEFHEAALKNHLCGKHIELLLRLVGLWPYQSLLARGALFILIETLAMSLVVPCAIFIIGAWGEDFGFIVGQLSGFYFFVSFPVCLFTAHTRVPQFQLLLSQASKIWQMLRDDFENDRVMEYSKLGHLLSLGFSSYVLMIWVSGTALLVLIPYMDITSPWENHTGPFLIIRTDYVIIDQRDHYYLASAHLSGFILPFVISLAGVSSVFLITVELTRGFFSVTRYRNIVLHQGATHEPQQLPVSRNDFALDDLRGAVILHSQTTKLCDLIEDALHPIALESQIFCVVQLALSYYCILEGGVPFAIKCCMVIIILGIYFFLMVMGVVGQSITDSSEEVFKSICTSDWHLAQPKDRRELLFIIQRSQDLSFLTAGKISTLSLESFVQLLKMSSSYFGALASMRA